MKLIVSALLLTAICGVTQGLKSGEKVRQIQDRYKHIKAVCGAKFDLTEKDMEHYDTQQAPETKQDKCLLACILTESGIMVDGKYSREGSDKITSYLYEDDPEILTQAREISKICEKKLEAEKISDECDVAMQLFTCVRKTTKRFNLKEE